MKISDKGIALIKQFEGCRLAAYKCPAGVLTIGYGHTGNVKEGQTITQTYADALLRSDLVRYEQKVAKYSQYTWNQNEFDALVSFAFNVGSIDQLTANGTRSRSVIADKILLYNKANGKMRVGLVKRRNAERELFLTPVNKVAGTGQIQNQTGIVTFSLKQDGEKRISTNFQVKEFRCKDGSDKIVVDVDFVRDKLQKIRNKFGAVTVNSAYRTETYNKKVGGAKSSYHMKGQAFDLVVKGCAPAELARYAQSIGCGGVIQYNSFVHVDNRAKKYYARNNNGVVTKVKSF